MNNSASYCLKTWVLVFRLDSMQTQFLAIY